MTTRIRYNRYELNDTVGSDKQQRWADDLMFALFERTLGDLLASGLQPEDAEDVAVRAVNHLPTLAKWWIERRAELRVPQALLAQAMREAGLEADDCHLTDADRQFLSVDVLANAAPATPRERVYIVADEIVRETEKAFRLSFRAVMPTGDELDCEAWFPKTLTVTLEDGRVAAVADMVEGKLPRPVELRWLQCPRILA